MERMAMGCKLNNEQLAVTWYADDSDEWGGDDFLKTFYFDQENTKKLFACLGDACPRDEKGLKKFLDEQFGHDLYCVGLDKYCMERDIHYEWHEYVDYPGIFDKWGSA